MATMYIRSTFALDEPTVHGLSQLARKWGVSKSEALRRAIARAQEHPGPGETMTPQAALRALKEKPLISRAEGKAWRKANEGARFPAIDGASVRAPASIASTKASRGAAKKTGKKAAKKATRPAKKAAGQ